MSSSANTMISTISKKVGIMVLFGVPAIIGGGIVYYLFDSYTAMLVYEAILGFTALGFISR
jgi:hypothetical protein